jgi:hypothetical protein
MPYTQRDNSPAAARYTKELKKYKNVMNNVTRSVIVSVREKNGMSRTARAVNKKLTARESGPHKAQKAESRDQRTRTAIATAEM